MKSKLITSISLLLVIVFTSCVSTKKYESSQAQSQKLQTELTACDNTLKNTNAKVDDLNKQVANLTNQNAALGADAAKYQALKAEAKASEAQLNAALAEQGTSMKEIEAKLVAGLSALIDSGMDVTYKEGLLHVTLPEKMLFPVGNATLNKSSKNALSPLASILNDYPKVGIYVVGHTDAMEKPTSRFPDSWSLSTERANSVVRSFIKNYAVDPARLLSAGRGKFMPIAGNDTKEGQAKNRRIDIILNPNLIKLYELMDK